MGLFFGRSKNGSFFKHFLQLEIITKFATCHTLLFFNENTGVKYYFFVFLQQLTKPLKNYRMGSE